MGFMKLQKNTLLLILLASILSVGVYFYEIRTELNKTENQQEQQLFTVQEKDIQKIIIHRRDRNLEFVRSPNNSESWQMKSPQDVPAEDGRMAFLLDLLVNGKKERSFTVPQQQLSQYGLEKPIGKITIETNNKQTQEIILGNPALEPTTIYAQIINPQGNNSEIEIVVVSQNWQYAIEPQVSEWIAQDE
jgi:hypothetical protein